MISVPIYKIPISLRILCPKSLGKFYLRPKVDVIIPIKTNDGGSCLMLALIINYNKFD